MPIEQPLTKETANPNAATAATSAFLRREPSLSLSSAAAAAALKARPTTPTNVAEVQSKRSLRRSASVSSAPGRDRTRGSRELRRTPSNGSMSERTFRSPSPSPGRSPAPRQHSVPPVPTLPRDAQLQPRRPTSSHKPGVTTLQTQQFRTASQKLKDGQQGSWFGGATARDNVSARTADAVLHSSPYRDDSRSGSVSPSINFSYPRASLEFPGPSDADVLVYDANSRRMVPKADLLARSQSMRETSEKSFKKKKSGVSRSGSHLSKGTIGRTQVAVSEGEQLPSYRKPTGESEPPRQQKPLEPRREEPSAPRPRTYEQGNIPNRAPVETEPAVKESTTLDKVLDDTTVVPSSDTSRAPAVGKEQLSTLQEKTTEDQTDTEDDEPIQHHEAIDSLPVRSSQLAVDEINGKPERQEQEATSPSAKRGSVRSARVHSESPARSARFAPATDKLLVRHEPPPRSLSPRKSALKHSSSVRGASPSDDGSETSGAGPSFSPKDESSRRKSVRVSFSDENNVVVGESAEPHEVDSPVVPSPQSTKKSWHSILGRNKKDSTALDSDEIMTPRPALPLFGSVRDKKHREPDGERPLVRPSERSWSPPPVSSSPKQAVPNDSHIEGPSTDSAIGSVLSQETISRNEANISRAREPLPPVVTSIEGTGYDSSSILTSEDETEYSDNTGMSETTKNEPSTVAETSENDPGNPEPSEESKPIRDETIADPADPNEPQKQQDSVAVADEAASKSGEANGHAEIPSISIINPSPRVQHDSPSSPELEYFDVPGGFPSGTETASSSRAELAAEQAGTSAPESDSTPQPVSSPVVAELSIPARSEPAVSSSPMAEIPEEVTDESSIYSDAYEDISDAEGDGFMSLDAVVAAPAGSKASKLYEKTKKQSQERASSDAAVNPENNEETREPVNSQDDWEMAKAYWRSLSVEKRRQLEKEALEEAAEEADHESSTTQKKAKKTISQDRPVSDISTSVPAPSDRVYQIPPGTTWALGEGAEVEEAARSAAPVNKPVAAPAFRKSMRGGQPKSVDETSAQQSGGTIRNSLRSNVTPGGAQGRPYKIAGTRPVSHQPSASLGTRNSTRRAVSSEPRPVSAGGLPSSSLRPAMTRRGSNDSDSSFKRSRAGGQGFFRSSRRAAPQEPDSPASKGSGRFSFRSLSPTGSTFRQPSSVTGPPAQQFAGGSMRTSMRQSLRTEQNQGKRPSKLTSAFGRSPGKKDKERNGSRFTDSSDEEDGGRPIFNSRFADSSDEDDALMQAPKRGGFPKTMRASSNGANSAAAAALGVQPARTRAQSPDVPFSDGELVQRNRSIMSNGTSSRAGGTLQRNRSGRGTLISPAGPGHLATDGIGERPAHQRRGSFISSILHRKKDNTNKIYREFGESAARRDTRLERSTEQLSVIRRSNSGGPRQLHKKEPSWPLPDEDDDDYNDGSQQVEAPGRTANAPLQRPATSAGPGVTPASKPGFLKRRSASHQVAAPPAPPPSDPGDFHKKKKFGALRRVFGLKD